MASQFVLTMPSPVAAQQNWEEGFETLFTGLVGTEWELVATLGLLLLGGVAGVLVWRNGRGPRGARA